MSDRAMPQWLREIRRYWAQLASEQGQSGADEPLAKCRQTTSAEDEEQGHATELPATRKLTGKHIPVQ